MVTFVFAAVLMLAAGLEKTLVQTGHKDNVIVLRGSADTEVSSVIERSAASIIEIQPEVEQNAKGEPLASKEVLVLVTLPKGPEGKPTNVVVRGVGAHSFDIRPQLKLTHGRAFTPGSREVVAGKNVASSIQGAHLGGALRFAMVDWNVVGTLEAGGSAFDSELWVDAEQLMSAFRRNAYSSVILRVPGSNSFHKLRSILESDPRLSVQVKRETQFYKEQSEVMSKFIRILGIAMTSFFSIGAILGAMVTMYSAVANRTKEIGTLRALGFLKRNILLSFLAESLVLGFIGGVVGLGFASLLQLLTISTMNWETFSELAFGFRLTPEIALYTLGFAMFMGFAGGLLPAWRAAGLQIVDSLRQD